MSYTIGDLVYNGERDSIHHWESISGMHFYWHPDWLHIAEDETGHKAIIKLDDTKKPKSHHDIFNLIRAHLKKHK